MCETEVILDWDFLIKTFSTKIAQDFYTMLFHKKLWNE